MADDLLKDDVILDNLDEAEDQPPAPTAGNGTSDDERRRTAEELEWSKLKGSTQDRVRELIKERNQYREQLNTDKTATNRATIPSAPAPNVGLTPDQGQIIQTLKSMGFVSKDELTAMQDRLVLDNEYSRLENTYSGVDSRPKFDRTEVEDHMRKTGIYNPEKAYKDLYEEELLDWRIKKDRSTRRPNATSERPSARISGTNEPLTKEYIQEKLSKPDGRMWWEKNRTKILANMSELND